MAGEVKQRTSRSTTMPRVLPIGSHSQGIVLLSASKMSIARPVTPSCHIFASSSAFSTARFSRAATTSMSIFGSSSSSSALLLSAHLPPVDGVGAAGSATTSISLMAAVRMMRKVDCDRTTRRPRHDWLAWVEAAGRD